MYIREYPGPTTHSGIVVKHVQKQVARKCICTRNQTLYQGGLAVWHTDVKQVKFVPFVHSSPWHMGSETAGLRVEIAADFVSTFIARCIIVASVRSQFACDRLC